jgi:tRNA-splicing ligase RtcB (3'-phosphate/5'-hydroxy nucleic acid ligase)
MKKRELIAMGLTKGEPLKQAVTALARASRQGLTKSEMTRTLRAVLSDPPSYAADPLFGDLATALGAEPVTGVLEKGAPWKQWGRNLEPQAVAQLEAACELPIAVAGALMPDAHLGYGLPIGGVLATRGAVIPYAVGVDIACRMKMTVLDLPMATLDEAPERLRKAIHEETRFGMGSCFKRPRSHDVMDHDWSVSPVTHRLKDKAWKQLGTSGGGNHFVEFGELEILGEGLALGPGRYLALLSHSGSRGTGAQVCQHYSKRAQSQCRDLPRGMQQLSWLDLESADGKEYWAAMELMGHYAAANHRLIHGSIAGNLGVQALLDVENHHNFAWKERHRGEDVIVHRKGATPAAKGDLGIIPGSMATPGYVVRGLGEALSLNSASHGAGRVMSRKKAKQTLDWRECQARLKAARVELLSAGLDEAPMVYKDIDEVMAAQRDLVEMLARFQPRLVKMAPDHERRSFCADS